MQQLQANLVSSCNLMPSKLETGLCREGVGASSLQLCNMCCQTYAL